MLHMALACNLLNAIGGEPQIDSANFVPRYPGHLPAGLRPDLTVTLRRCSIDQIRDVFLSIEEPEVVLARVPNGTLAEVSAASLTDLPPAPHAGAESGASVNALAGLPKIDTRGVAVDQDGHVVSGGAGAVAATESGSMAAASGASAASEAASALERWFTTVTHPAYTIGWFYNQIARAIIALEKDGTNIFTGDPARQLTPAVWPNAPGRLYRIENKESALLAIHEIVRQGEGTSLNDPTDGRDELAHYYKFKEIVEGRQMVRKPDGTWAFDGPAIPFDPDGVYPMVDDPDPASLPANSLVKAMSRQFDATYGDLLRSLHQTVNGHPERLNAAIGLMYSVEVAARELMRTQISTDPPTNAGPAFLAE
jgi:hypothetical protein